MRIMVYHNVTDLPESVKGNLPLHAQEIYKEAFNNAYKEYDRPQRRDNSGREETAHKVAWAAVKKKYEKDSSGNWTEKQKR